MKKILPFFILLLTLTNSAFAFDPNGKKHPDIDGLVFELQLDDAKAAQLRMLMEKHIAEIEQQHQENKQSHDQMRSIHESHREEMFALLGAEKMYQFENYMRQFRPKRRGNKRPPF